jgi:hypothetical protein
MAFVLIAVFLAVPLAGMAFPLTKSYRLNRKRFWSELAQVLVVLLALSGWYAHRTIDLLAAPPSGDLYAHTWGFQLMVFALMYLPATLVALTVLLLVEHVIQGRRRA